MKKDEIVFYLPIGVHKKEILMLTSGGYSSQSANLVSASIENLFENLPSPDSSILRMRDLTCQDLTYYFYLISNMKR